MGQAAPQEAGEPILVWVPVMLSGAVGAVLNPYLNWHFYKDAQGRVSMELLEEVPGKKYLISSPTRHLPVGCRR